MKAPMEGVNGISTFCAEMDFANKRTSSKDIEHKHWWLRAHLY